jgi:hypothetical protein
MYLQTIALAEDRVAQLAQERRRPGSFGPPDRDLSILRGARRLLARGLVAVSLASAAAVERLDACLAEDLIRPMAPDGA